MVLTRSSVLFPVSMTLLVTVASRVIPRRLTPAQGCQNHTALPSAYPRRTSDDAIASIASRLNVRDDASAPLQSSRDARINVIIFRKTE